MAVEPTRTGDKEPLEVGGVAVTAMSVAAETAEDATSASEAAVLSSEAVAGTLGEYLAAWWRRVRSGESGVLPVVGALVAIVVIFQAQNSLFLSGPNLVNLLQQGVVIVMFGMAEVFVLLLGEIDLSVVYEAGIGAGIMAALVASPANLPWWVAILAGLAATALAGLIQGVLITRLGLPSFIVTLGGYIGFEGLMLWMFDHMSIAVGGVIEVSNHIMLDLVAGAISPVASWVLMIALVVVFGTYLVVRDMRRRASGLVTPPFGLTVIKIAFTAAAGVLVVLVSDVNRGVKGGARVEGVPWAVPIVLAILALATFLLGRTRFGRYIYAVGGNAEAARRAGVNLYRIRTIAFALSGLMAGFAGLMYLSLLGSIATDIDPDYVLYAVAAAVIGGTSLFGGRGKAVHALLGALVIAAIANGLGLLGMGAAATDMVTALVLIAAITVDSVARRGERAR
ncbi:MAG: sugar ABC transporter permease [Acidimicrobiales bacterium]